MSESGGVLPVTEYYLIINNAFAFRIKKPKWRMKLFCSLFGFETHRHESANVQETTIFIDGYGRESLMKGIKKNGNV